MVRTDSIPRVEGPSVDFLMERLFSLEMRGIIRAEGYPLLFAAALSNVDEAVKVLLDLGADVNEQTNFRVPLGYFERYSPIHLLTQVLNVM